MIICWNKYEYLCLCTQKQELEQSDFYKVTVWHKELCKVTLCSKMLAGTHGNTEAQTTTRYYFYFYFLNKEHRGEGLHNIKELPNRDHQLPGSLLATKSLGTEQRHWPVVRHYHLHSKKKTSLQWFKGNSLALINTFYFPIFNWVH